MSKGALEMTNLKTTADAVGAIFDNDSFSPPFASRKGEDVMSNRRDVSDMTNGDDIVGFEDIIGAEHSMASAMIDERICRNLKPSACAAYMLAVGATNKVDFCCASTKLLLTLAGDHGLGSMVKSIPAANAEFGNLGLMHRAIVRRLFECCDGLCAAG